MKDFVRKAMDEGADLSSLPTAIIVSTGWLVLTALILRFVAPMPGKIVAVRCEPGARVARGQVLVVLEAMKMEHAILAPADGLVEALRCRQGEQVTEGSELLVFRPEAP